MRKLAFLVTFVVLLVASATVLAKSYTSPCTDAAPTSAYDVPLITNAI
jgi:hypothetical protein